MVVASDMGETNIFKAAEDTVSALKASLLDGQIKARLSDYWEKEDRDLAVQAWASEADRAIAKASEVDRFYKQPCNRRDGQERRWRSSEASHAFEIQEIRLGDIWRVMEITPAMQEAWDAWNEAGKSLFQISAAGNARELGELDRIALLAETAKLTAQLEASRVLSRLKEARYHERIALSILAAPVLQQYWHAIDTISFETAGLAEDAAAIETEAERGLLGAMDAMELDGRDSGRAPSTFGVTTPKETSSKALTVLSSVVRAMQERFERIGSQDIAGKDDVGSRSDPSGLAGRQTFLEYCSGIAEPPPESVAGMHFVSSVRETVWRMNKAGFDLQNTDLTEEAAQDCLAMLVDDADRLSKAVRDFERAGAEREHSINTNSSIRRKGAYALTVRSAPSRKVQRAVAAIREAGTLEPNQTSLTSAQKDRFQRLFSESLQAMDSSMHTSEADRRTAPGTDPSSHGSGHSKNRDYSDRSRDVPNCNRSLHTEGISRPSISGRHARRQCGRR